MKKWDITYLGSFLGLTHVAESYGETKQEAIDYAVNSYKIIRTNIISCKLKQ